MTRACDRRLPVLALGLAWLGLSGFQGLEAPEPPRPAPPSPSSSPPMVLVAPELSPPPFLVPEAYTNFTQLQPPPVGGTLHAEIE